MALALPRRSLLPRHDGNLWLGTLSQVVEELIREPLDVVRAGRGRLGLELRRIPLGAHAVRLRGVVPAYVLLRRLRRLWRPQRDAAVMRPVVDRPRRFARVPLRFQLEALADAHALVRELEALASPLLH